jgi:putative membrane protein
MIKKQFATFLIRWLISSVSMWICINLFASFKEGSDIQHSFWMSAAAGLVFSLVNSFVKPLATIFALPAIFLTLGLFTILVNTAMVGLTIWIIPDVYISFWGAVGSCLVISVINFLVNLAMPDVK